MKAAQDVYSRYISNGIIGRKSNLFFEKIIRLFLIRLKFDSESLDRIKEYSSKGNVVYVSFQSTNTSLLIFINLIRRSGRAVPVLALDFASYPIQVISTFIKKAAAKIRSIFKETGGEPVSDYDFIENTIINGGPVVLSILSRRLFLRRYLEIKSDSLQYLIDVQKTIDKPIYIMPQIMFWNRNPERTRALVTSRATGDRGLLSAVFTLFKSATDPFMRISTPLDLKEEIGQSPSEDSKQIARRIRNKLLEIYNHEKRTVLGPVIKSQQEMMEKVLYHKNVMDEITRESGNMPSSLRKNRRNAYRYFREIAADFSIIYIKYFDRAVSYVNRKIFDGISYDLEDFKKIKDASQKGPLIIMPGHKSHMDYLIVSSVFYHEKIIPPHIVAGSNLIFFPMGKIFRRSGAFFMRRSFKGLDLYAAVFKQYLKSLINEGYSIEFFIEGGRSRTGKLLIPKMGILKYLIDSIEEGYNRDMVFLPVSINYDRILEESSHHEELRGRKKSTESTSTLIKSRKFLKRKFGKVYLTFNEPVPYSELREKFGYNEDLTNNIGNYIIRRINDIILVTPFSITSTAILLSYSRGFTRGMLKDSMSTLSNYLEYAGAPLSEALQSTDNFDEIIDYVIESYREDAIIKKLDIEDTDNEGAPGGDLLYVIAEEERARINYYRNNIIHFFLPAAFISLVLLKLYNSDFEVEVEKIKEDAAALKEVFSMEFIFPDIMDDPDETIQYVLRYFEKRSVLSIRDDRAVIDPSKISEVLLYARLIKDVIESYLVVFSAVCGISGTLDRRDFNHEIRKNGIRMYHLGEIDQSESLSMQNYNNAIGKLIQLKIISEKRISRKHSDMEILNTARADDVCHVLKKFHIAINRLTYNPVV